MNNKISVICPFYNEESIILESAIKMLDILSNCYKAWELILVNDGSTDSSLSRLHEVIHPNSEKIRILTSTVNQGRGRAIKNGIDIAIGEIIVTTEIDCSWGEDIVPRLVNELVTKNLHVVIASPHLKGGGLINVPLKRIFLTKFGNLLIRLFTNINITMYTGMTRGYLASVIKPIRLNASGKEAHLEILLKLFSLDFRIGEIPAVIEWSKKKNNQNVTVRKSSTNIRKTIYTHLTFILTAQPRIYFLAFAASTFLLSFLSIIIALFNYFENKPSILLVIISIALLTLTFILIGFSIMLSEIRAILKERWSSYYPDNFRIKTINAIESKIQV